MLYLAQFTGLILIALINGDTGEDCPTELSDLELDPPELVLKYGDPVSVNCSSHSIFTDLFWSVPLGNTSSPDNQTVTWETDKLTAWEIYPVCYMTLDGTQCRKSLPVKVYKLPDQVSISTVSHTGPMSSYVEYKLQCDIQNVAPRHLLTVNWYKGDHLVDSVSFTNTSSKIPGNVSTILQIHPSEDDDREQYRCEAKLNLGAGGPQPSPTVISDPLDITISKNLSHCSDLELVPPGMVIQLGEPASVSCHSLSNYTYLGWTVPQENDSIPDNQTITWKTDNVSDWEMQPMCYRIADVKCKKPFKLIIYKLPDQVSISVVNHTGPMIEDKKYELQCEIQNFAPVNLLAVSWYKGDKLVKNRGFSDLPTKTPSNKTITLKITASKDEGKAPYTCMAKLKLGPNGPQPNPVVQSNHLNVEVRYKPVLTCPDWSAMLNTSLNEYPYTALGNPSPNITWYRNKSPINPDMLLSREDSGEYKLIASNVMGKAQCDAYITVEYAPTFKCPESYEGREQESFDKCSVMASPEAIITWKKDGKTVSPVHTLTRGDNGSYVITAVNKHGTKHHNLTIYVLYGPEIEPDSSNVVVLADEDMSLSCTAEGNPEPEVQWSFQNQIKATGRRQTTLTISKASFVDEGNYMCTATNDLGNDTRTVSLMVEGSCPIILKPVKLVVEFDMSASAVCSTNANHNGVGWEASQGAVDMQKEVKAINWSVQHVQHWDLQPMCYINTMRDQCTRKLPITIYKRPDQVSVSSVNHTGPMIEGREYELLCDVQNVAPANLLTVKWYKGQHLVTRKSFSNERKIPVNKNSALQISPHRDEDGAQYRCEAELNLGPEGPQPHPIVTSDLLHITVYYKPVVNCSNWSAMLNTSLNEYPYTILGNPSPSITWYRNKSPINPDMLLSSENSGQYEIIASNEMGNTPCDTNITVEYAPTFKCPESYEGREHESFDKCSVMASPEAIITWKKDGKTVSPVHTLTRRDNGSYVLTAVNKHGTKHHNLNIYVLYGPEIQRGKSLIEVNVGGKVSLSCTAEGNPKPEVSWSFRNQTKVSGGWQKTLMISKVESVNAGEYICTATNELGIDTWRVSLAVQESNLRLILISLGIILAILILIAYLVYLYIDRKRSGRYNIEANGAVSMSLLNQNQGNGTTTSTEKAHR